MFASQQDTTTQSEEAGDGVEPCEAHLGAESGEGFCIGEAEADEDIGEVGADPEGEEEREDDADPDATDIAADGADGEEEGTEHGAVGVGDHSKGEGQEIDASADGLEADGDKDEGNAPEDHGTAGLEEEGFLVGIFEAIFSMDEGEGGLGESGQGGVEAGYCGGKGAGENQSAEAWRKDCGDPDGEHAVSFFGKERGLGGGGGVLGVVNHKGGTDKKHDDSDKQADAAEDDGLAGVCG